MTICRYFLQGTCRFGDRCRFEHTASNYDNYESQRNVAGYHYQERNTRQRSQSNNYGQYNQHENYGYESNYNYNSKPRSYSSDNYAENYQQSPTARYSSDGYRDNRYQSNNYYEAQRSYSPDRYSDTRVESRNYKQGYEAQPRYNEHSYGRNQQFPSNNYQNDNIHGQNKYQWVSDNYKKQTQQKSYSSNEYVDNSYVTSTPKEKVPFSFKLPESEIKKRSSEQFQVSEQDQLHAELVKEDAKAWELGGLWPFTCYFPCSNKHAFPGFYDLSPEELRYAAYKAEENNAYESYVKSVKNALEQINQQRSQLQISTPQLLTTLRRIWDGENMCSTTSNIYTSIPFIHHENTGIDTMDTPIEHPASSSAASFSFKIIDEATPSTSAFSFKLPSTETKSTVISVPAGDADVYTPLENLTEEEKEQFSASTFSLGKIPTKPPPQVLCT